MGNRARRVRRGRGRGRGRGKGRGAGRGRGRGRGKGRGAGRGRGRGRGKGRGAGRGRGREGERHSPPACSACLCFQSGPEKCTEQGSPSRSKIHYNLRSPRGLYIVKKHGYHYRHQWKHIHRGRHHRNDHPHYHHSHHHHNHPQQIIIITTMTIIVVVDIASALAMAATCCGAALRSPVNTCRPSAAPCRWPPVASAPCRSLPRLLS